MFPFRELLELDPRLAYFAQRGRAGASPYAQRFFQSNFGNVQNQFMGELGRQIMRGQAPTLRFADFLEGLDFPNQLLATPQQRQRLNPPTRFLY